MSGARNHDRDHTFASLCNRCTVRASTVCHARAVSVNSQSAVPLLRLSMLESLGCRPLEGLAVHVYIALRGCCRAAAALTASLLEVANGSDQAVACDRVRSLCSATVS